MIRAYKLQFLQPCECYSSVVVYQLNDDTRTVVEECEACEATWESALQFDYSPDLDPETQVLTGKGWKLISDIEIDDWPKTVH